MLRHDDKTFLKKIRDKGVFVMLFKMAVFLEERSRRYKYFINLEPTQHISRTKLPDLLQSKPVHLLE